MKNKFLLLSIPITISSIFFNKDVAQAAYFTPLTGYTKADLEAEINSGSFVEEFNAASYIGDRGLAAYELELNNIIPPNTVDLVSSSHKQFLWQNGQEVDFEISFDGEILKYQVGDRVLSAINVIEADFDNINGMIFSASSTKNSKAELSNLIFADGSMSYIDLMSQDGEIDFLKVTGIDKTFTLTGTQTFSWTGERPENFDLAYQIRVGTFKEPKSDLYDFKAANLLLAEEVPEPKNISLFSLILVGMVLTYRRR